MWVRLDIRAFLFCLAASCRAVGAAVDAAVVAAGRAQGGMMIFRVFLAFAFAGIAMLGCVELKEEQYSCHRIYISLISTVCLEGLDVQMKCYTLAVFAQLGYKLICVCGFPYLVFITIYIYK